MRNSSALIVGSKAAGVSSAIAVRTGNRFRSRIATIRFGRVGSNVPVKVAQRSGGRKSRALSLDELKPLSYDRDKSS